MVQSCPEASPTKWHLAHTAWFFESFVLREFLPGYKLFHKDFPWLFNSYYRGFSAIPEKKLRASFSRPSLAEVLAYRKHVDEAMEQLFLHQIDPEALRRIDLGVNHEEQHQELILTDVLNAFFTDPLRPAYLEGDGSAPGHPQPDHIPSLAFRGYEGKLLEVGHSGEGFCFDNELPRHRVWLEPFRLATRLVTCAEYAAFMADGAYSRPELWLSAGWDALNLYGWRAPLYWTEEAGSWSVFTLRGTLPLQALENTPVSHVSFYEADAYARWAGRRLPTEFEWEAAAQGSPVDGNFFESGLLMPSPALIPGNSGAKRQDENGTKYFGDCWQWTASAYLGYPGFKTLEGTLGEYNGKFMSGQMVLRGGSCITPKQHIRASYRNFFAPETRWQFSGIRLAS